MRKSVKGAMAYTSGGLVLTWDHQH